MLPEIVQLHICVKPLMYRRRLRALSIHEAEEEADEARRLCEETPLG